ncbi:MAG: phosphoribosylglycinamide formyltransferase [Phycisphaerales bacterium]
MPNRSGSAAVSFDALPKFHTPARLAVLLSGSGRTLDNLLERIEQGTLDATIPVVIASKECLGAQKARDAGIETHVHTGRLDSAWLDSICDAHKIDLVVLAGYLKLVPISDRVRHRVINIHPALLPSFGGRGMHGHHVHEAVVEAATRGEVNETGCTVHFADDEYDTGSVILQHRCPVDASDSPDELAARVFTLECEAYPEALKMLIERNASRSGANNPA